MKLINPAVLLVTCLCLVASQASSAPPATNAPAITQQPSSLAIHEGEAAQFSVQASGTQPLRFRWRFEGNYILGATQSTLGLSNVVLSQAGRYDVVVTNSAGSVTSAVANLTVDRLRLLEIGSGPPQPEGTSIILPLRLFSTGDVGGLNFAVRYDPDYLRALELTWSPELAGAFTEVNTSQPGLVRGTLVFADATIAGGTQTVAALSFHLRTVPRSLSTSVTLESLELSGANGEQLSGNLGLGSHVDITARTIPGDNNANNRVDVGDATTFLRYLAQLEEVRSWDITLNDLNLNGILDQGDAIKALRVVSGLDPQPGVSFPPAASGSNVVLSPPTIQTSPGRTVTVQVALRNMSVPLSGVSFVMNYDTNALRLLAANPGALVPKSAYRLWNTTAVPGGGLALAACSATPWPANNGVVAELNFEVQPYAASQSSWPITVSAFETTEDGYKNHLLNTASSSLSAQPQIAGLVQLEEFAGAGRMVSFMASGGSSNKSWILNLNFNGGTASYLLSNVPPGTTALSAKTAWNLRVKLPVTLDADGKGVANFVNFGTAGWNYATDHCLRGGDLTGDNSVGFQDYSILGTQFYTFGSTADITGDGQVDYEDYFILSSKWFTVGDSR